MANQRQKHDDETPARPDEAEREPRPRDGERRERDRPAEDRNGEIDEGLEETFPASDPPAPSRPTGAE